MPAEGAFEDSQTRRGYLIIPHSLFKSHRHRHRDLRAFLGQRAAGALGFGDLFGDQLGEFAIDLLLVGTVADAADEEVGAIADEEPVCVAPLHDFAAVGFYFPFSQECYAAI